MSISMFKASVPPILHSLGSLRAILKKGAAHAEARKIDPSVLVNARLAPDMYPLSRQVQIASDVAKGGGARLAGVEAPKFEDKESSFPELIARIDKTEAFLKKLKASQIDGSEGRTITLTFPSGTWTFNGLDYLLGFVMPNLYFHLTATYAILRHNGVDVGKGDFLGGGRPPKAPKPGKPAARKARKK